MKIYARQISPECQESPLFLHPDFFPDDIAVCGNRDFIAHKCAIFEQVEQVLNDGDLADAIASDYTTPEGIAAFINDYLPAVGREYSADDIHALEELIALYGFSVQEDREIICKVLTIMTGRRWDWLTIHGSVQDDWNYIFYPVNAWPHEAINAFEIEYFNTGSEWIIHDEETAPEGPEDITGFAMYCLSWRDEDIQEEIAQATGARPEDVILYAFKGWRRVPEYYQIG